MGGVPAAVGELEDGRVERILEERHFDVGQDSYGSWFSDPDR
jgi:hypothetical protein